MKRFAFTLAEVLITLGIIGVVAAMTIPTLMKNTNKAEYVTTFKKEYSVLNNAWRQLIYDNGGSNLTTYSTADDVVDAICTKIKCVKICKAADSSGCFVSTDWKNLVGQASWQNIAGASAILPDGTSFAIDSWNTTGGQLHFDINNLKPPNVMGRDIFELEMYDKNIVPTGAGGTSMAPYVDQSCSNAGVSYPGATCGTKILIENAMNY